MLNIKKTGIHPDIVYVYTKYCEKRNLDVMCKKDKNIS